MGATGVRGSPASTRAMSTTPTTIITTDTVRGKMEPKRVYCSVTHST
jgi:hypothetical protein